ncbi:MAG: hydroxymethylglutaryl-CoA lyase, partial [Burkholderiales bacterium]|nr:hydroxymethylglutaryl-CoA lyase [Burkholderiales bacterium]
MNTDTPVILRDTSLRDGLQSLARTVPTEVKRQWLRALFDAGLREVEVGSFVPARLLPQLADTAEIVATARELPGLVCSVLVPNVRGAQAAIDAGAAWMLLPLSASHAHSLANLRKTPDDAVAEVGRIRALRDAAGSRCGIEVGISTAFGCTIQGAVSEDEVVRLVAAVLDAGAERVGLADTVGYADPLQVARLFERCLAVAGDRLACGHFHDTRGLGLANTYAAWQAGISRFDGCVGGIGGCPHAPGASGNVATEDLAYLFASMGVPTGLDFKALMALRVRLGSWLEGEPLHGSIWRAG